MTRLGHVVQQVAAAEGSETRPFLALENLGSMTGDLLPGADMPALSPEPTGMVGFEPGDVLFGKLRPYLAKSWLADRSGLCSSELIVMRPREAVDPAWLAYLVQSGFFVGWAVATSEGVKMPRTSWEKVRQLELSIPPLDRQRVITAYLDESLADMHRLLILRRAQSELLKARLGLVLQSLWNEDGLASVGLAVTDLRREIPRGWRALGLNRVLVQMTNGYVGPTRDILRDEGVAYVQSANIKLGGIDLARRPFFVDPLWHQAHRRTALRPGDVLVVQTGDIGQVALVPADLGPANCHALLILRVDRRVIRPAYLFWHLRSDFGYQALRNRATGALHPHLEAGEIGSLPMILPPLAIQDRYVALLADVENEIAHKVGQLDRQVGLLLERRQALITAAVTGQLEIAGVAA